MRRDPSLSDDGRHQAFVDLGPSAPARSRPAAWATRPARTILAASLLISMELPFVGTTPGTAEAAPNTTSPGLTAVALDEGPPTDPSAGDPAAAADPAAAPGAPNDGLIHLSLIPGDNEVRFVMRL